MGIFSRPARSQARSEPILAPVEQRASRYTDGWGIGYSGTATGQRGAMSVHLAESLTAVTACVELIAGAIASLPTGLVVDTPDGRQPAPPTVPAWRILQRPNRRQSWTAFVQQAIAQILLHGNFVAAIGLDGRGATAELTPVPWPWLLPQIVRSAGGSRLVFNVLEVNPEAALLNLPARLLDTDVMHVRARSDHGVIGRSVLSRASHAVNEGADLASLAEALFRNGLSLSGFVETGGVVLTAAQREQFQASLERLRGASNGGKTMLLEGAFSYNPLSVTPADAELLSSRQFSVAEIARLFCIPEPLLQLGQRIPASLDPYVTAFAQLALAPLINLIEDEFDAAVLPPDVHLQIDLAGMLRGNFSAMTAAMCAAVQTGIATPNDGRRALGLPAADGGDDLRAGNAPNWPADRPGMPHLGPSPGPTGGGVPEPGNHQNGGSDNV